MINRKQLAVLGFLLILVMQQGGAQDIKQSSILAPAPAGARAGMPPAVDKTARIKPFPELLISQGRRNSLLIEGFIKNSNGTWKRVTAGSGFVAGPGLVFTANHLQQYDKEFKVVGYVEKILVNGREAQIVKASHKDLLLLRVNLGRQYGRSFRFRPMPSLKEEIAQIGNPGLAIGTLSIGEVVAFGGVNGQEEKFVFINAIARPGNSGSILFNRKTEIVGMTIMLVTQPFPPKGLETGWTIARPSEDLLAMFDKRFLAVNKLRLLRHKNNTVSVLSR